jgi:uncharacterized cupin superfamily protein
MSRNVITIDQAPPIDAFVPTNTVAPGCLISGTPNERGVRQFTSDDGKASAGVWACGTYREHIPGFPTDELFFVLEGTVTISEAGSEPQTYRPGDAFVIRRGTVCDFDATGPFRKIYMGYEPQPIA